MGTLEKVMQMRQQGQTDSQIIQNLQREGISPREINESISQSQIKSELINPQDYNQSDNQSQYGEEQMQQSLSQMNTPQAGFGQYQGFAQQEGQEPMQGSQMMPDQGYQTNQYQDYAQAVDMATINEIADQIVEEKTNQLKKQIATLIKFKEEKTSEIDMLNQRLSKIENSFNDLQMAIIGRIGEYGQDIKNIAKEMHMTQDSFSKIINPLTDRARGYSDSEENTRPKPKTTSKSDKPEFEDYLR